MSLSSTHVEKCRLDKNRATHLCDMGQVVIISQQTKVTHGAADFRAQAWTNRGHHVDNLARACWKNKHLMSAFISTHNAGRNAAYMCIIKTVRMHQRKNKSRDRGILDCWLRACHDEWEIVCLRAIFQLAATALIAIYVIISGVSGKGSGSPACLLSWRGKCS